MTTTEAGKRAARVAKVQLREAMERGGHQERDHVIGAKRPDREGQEIPGSRPSESKRPEFQSLQLLIHEVVCEKTTRELVAKDDIKLAGIETLTEVSIKDGQKLLKAKARKGSILAAGKFRKGDAETFRNPKVLAEIPLGPRGGEWPREFSATVLMAEMDGDKLGPIVALIVDAIDDEVGKAVAGAATSLAAGILAGSAVGSLVPIPVVGTVAGAVAGAVTAGVTSALKKAQAPDVFPPERAKFALDAYPSAAGPVADSRKTLHFEGHGGVYRVVCSWCVA